ncbi:DUF5667 domain-containing protein [Nocardioides aquiterrae]|uniref:DUF5667 domain-containing protein n=1 Tax=Nocardioides aquiterrae TaxID=203799 RepID=A0ABN1UB17_9ACTN
MTWGFPAHRRADEFNEQVEALSTAPAATRDADLLELVGALRTVPQVAARPEFVADLRAQLMAEAATALVPADTSRLTLPQRRPTRERRLAAVVGGIAVVGVTTGVAVASQGALPGDSLYPVKRAIESAHTGLSVGEGSKGTAMLGNAADRLDEVDALAHQDGLGDDLRIADTLNTFADQATQASDLLLADYAHTGDPSSIAKLHDFASSSLGQLAALEPLVPAEARDELIRAAGVLQGIDAAAGQRCPSCGGTPIDSIPPVLIPTETVFVPAAASAPTAEPSTGAKKSDPKKGDGGGPDLPNVQPDNLGPGSVSDPDSGPSSDPTGGGDPLQAITSTLTGGGGTHHTPAENPPAPSADDVVDGVTGILEGVVDGLTGQQTPAP